ncbi:MAG: DUF1080 domain-containing protein [Gemmataceae bacterium]
MKRAVLLLAALSLAGFAAAGDDFRPAFNGKDLKGWQTEGNWHVEKGGVVALTPRPGEKGWERYGSYLWTEKPYGDFVIDLEYKHGKGGNSGVFIRTKDIKKDSPKSGIEVQILDSYGKKGELTHHDCGGIIQTCPPSKNMAKPAGEWNRMIVSCKGTQLKVNLNGEQIVDIDLAKGPMKDRPLVGYIGIQDHGEPFWVRNVKLKELK